MQEVGRLSFNLFVYTWHANKLPARNQYIFFSGTLTFNGQKLISRYFEQQESVKGYLFKNWLICPIVFPKYVKKEFTGLDRSEE